MPIKTNERELSQKVTQWFDEFIKGASFSFKEVTAESSVKSESGTLFPDLVLWYNRATNEACSFVELKPPFGQKENIDQFRKKGLALKVKYAFIWDFQKFNKYEFVNGKERLINTESIPVLSNIEEWKRGDKQALIKTLIRKICEELAHLLETGKPREFIPDKVFFVELIRKTTEQLKTVFEPFIHHAQLKRSFKEIINRYARLQGIRQTENYTKVLTGHVVYGLVTKVIFYLTIRRYFNDLPSFDEVGVDLNSAIRRAFSKAREKDWQAVFEEDPIEQLGIPKEAYDILRGFFSELRAYHFGELPEDVIGQLFEEIIDPDQRHSLGQYFTREDLVDLVLATVVNEPDGVYGDPTCGSGTFLVRLYDRLKYLSNNRGIHEERLNQIWGFDIGKFPAELSTINLFRQDVSNFQNFPRVRKTDIFDVREGDTFDFPPPHSGSSSLKVQLKLPQFDALVGNFPYIRQELIEKEFSGYKKKLTKLLADEFFHSYPKLFTRTKGFNKEQFVSPKQIQTAAEKEWLDLSLSGQADIYSYIFLHTSKFLNKNGSFAIITSNSWLDVSFGAVLKQFFLDHFRIRMVIASWAEPWFEDAAVNTVITVLEKEDNELKRNENNIHFVKLKKKLADIVSYDIKLQSTKRWQKFDALVNSIEEAEYQKDCKTIAKDITSLETDDMRVRILPQKVIATELQERGDLAKWGKYLRAPDIYFEILEKCSEKLVPLKSVADVRFGIKTGVNEFFYLEKVDKAKRGLVTCRNARGWEGQIEEKYLLKIIKSPKESNSLIIDPEKLKFFIFTCNKSKADLKKAGDIGALKYIEWGEKQKTGKTSEKKSDGKPWKEVPSVKSRKYWWGISESKMPEIIYPCGIDNTFKVYENSVRVLNDKRLYKVYTKGEEILKPLLNSTLSSFFVEANSRISLGDGLLDLTVYEVEEIPTPNPAVMDKQLRSKIQAPFTKMLHRKIEPIFDEIKKKDRMTLDTIILESLGLDVQEYLPRIYEGICEMVKERLELPKMRKKQQKEKVSLALDQIKQSAIEECLSDGPKRFPEDFYDRELTAKEIEQHSTSGESLTYEHFFGQYEIKDERGQKIFTADSEYKAEFALLLAKLDVYILKIPKDEKIVKKALSKYKKYVAELKDKLIASSHSKTHDWSIAERVADEILDEYGMKN